MTHALVFVLKAYCCVLRLRLAVRSIDGNRFTVEVSEGGVWTSLWEQISEICYFVFLDRLDRSTNLSRWSAFDLVIVRQMGKDNESSRLIVGWSRAWLPSEYSPRSTEDGSDHRFDGRKFWCHFLLICLMNGSRRDRLNWNIPWRWSYLRFGHWAHVMPGKHDDTKGRGKMNRQTSFTLGDVRWGTRSPSG